MPSLGTEVAAVQLPMLRYAQDIGWKGFAQISPDETESSRMK
jgi:hypothetical protein